MKLSKCLLALVLISCYAGCSPKLNDGLTPTQPIYSNVRLPNPLVLYSNGAFTAGVSLASPYLPPPYNAGLTINYADTSVKPDEGTSNLLLGVTNFNPSGNAVTTTFVGYGLVPANPTTMLDLSSGGYQNAIFDAMVTCPANGVTQVLDFAAAGGTAQAVTFITPCSWAPQTIAMPIVQTSVSQLFVVTFNNDLLNDGTTAPVTLYIDNLRFQ